MDGWLSRRLRDLRAASHYRPSQLAHRGAIQLRRRIAGALPRRGRARLAALASHPPPPAGVAPCPPLLSFALDRGVNDPERAEDLLAGRFRFLGRTVRFGTLPDWNDRRPEGHAHLWRMNLHYHRFLVDAAAGALRQPERAGALLQRAVVLLDDWAARCPPYERAGWADAWNSYAVSSRLLHAWTARLLLATSPPPTETEGLIRRLDALGASHAAFLVDWLEHDLGGNHLLRNASALAAAGRWFSGPDAQRWRETGDRLLVRELSRQLLPDGFHEERSPMYHVLLLEELLLGVFCGDGRDRLPAVLAQAPARMLAALAPVVHPDGEIALFNDAALGIAPPPAAIAALASGLGIESGTPVRDLPHAGYFRFGTGGDVLIFDAGPLGPDHLPAHAHCDALSFELSLAGRRLVTDTGVDRYAPGPERTYQRGTAAHSTLQVDGLEQAEAFGSFRMGRRPRVRGRRLDERVAEGEHDGYRPAALHRRQIVWNPGAGSAWAMEWIDQLQGDAPQPCTVRVQVAPDVAAEASGSRALLGGPEGERLALDVPSHGTLAVLPGLACPRFGESVPRPVLTWRGTGRPGEPLRFTLRRL